ncbi:MAG: hypothetical protein AB1578_00490 [Thermodesulfobacteriota bacterium]
MEHAILVQLTAAILLFATPSILRRGLPSTEPFSKFFADLFRSVRSEPRSRGARRGRRAAMRGARPWWE